MNPELNYQPHQRDYTVLGASSVFQAIMSPELRDVFGYQTNPMYVVVRDGILTHYYAEEDAIGRAHGWVASHSLEDIQQLQQENAERVAHYRQFLASVPSTDPIAGVQAIEQYYREILPATLVSLEVPEHAPAGTDPELIACAMAIRTLNEDVYKIGESAMKECVERVDEKHGLPMGSTGYLAATEFVEFAKTGARPSDLSHRSTFVLVTLAESGTTVTTDPTATKQYDFMNDQVDESIAELQGRTAQPGYARGRVRIIRLISDMADFQPGEILVASMTDPRYVSIMKQAAAIVTDEGGITSHAAIVSRELGVPCVIGTKIATNIFIDGDLVEVDATKGIVRRLA